MKSLFVTATGTELGKTLVTAALAHQLRQQGKHVRVLKPIMSGFDERDMATSDAGVLLTAMGRAVDGAGIAVISPWRFAAPLSPHMAAALENKSISLSEVVNFCSAEADGDGDVLLIEGVGGVMVPLNGTATVLDWMAALGAPVLLTAGSYLGAISHALTALEVLTAKGMVVAAVIVSESPDSPAGLDATVSSIAGFAGNIPVSPLPRIGPGSRPPWQRAPDLTYLLDV